MNNLITEDLIGIAIIGSMMLLMVILSLPKNLAKRIILGDIRSLQKYKKAINNSIEDGKHIHVSLGHANLLSPNNASSFIGLSMLDNIIKLGIKSDRPPLATSGDGTLAILSRDTMKAASQEVNAYTHYSPHRAYMSGATPYSYMIGTLPIVQNHNVSTNNLIGFFSPEAGYLGMTAHQHSTYMIAGTESLPTQAVMLGTTQDTLLGEEIFGMPAYLFGRPIDVVSLKTQDAIRWILIIFIVFSILIKIISGLMG